MSRENATRRAHCLISLAFDLNGRTMVLVASSFTDKVHSNTLLIATHRSWATGYSDGTPSTQHHRILSCISIETSLHRCSSSRPSNSMKISPSPTTSTPRLPLASADLTLGVCKWSHHPLPSGQQLLAKRGTPKVKYPALPNSAASGVLK
jgi:hypothetical protein